MARSKRGQSPVGRGPIGLSVVLSIAATGAWADERPRLEAACPAYDLHITTLIEDHGIAGTTEPEVLGDTALRLVDARVACRNGDVERALRIYESVDLGSVRTSSFYRVWMR
jgi:hypothetical protein